MALRSELTGNGMPPALAQLLGSDTPATAVVATGSALADSVLLTSNFSMVTTSSASTGVQLPSATGQGPLALFNGSGQTIYVYPQVGQYVNGKAVGASASSNSVAVSVTDGKAVIGIPAGNRWILVQS